MYESLYDINNLQQIKPRVVPTLKPMKLSNYEFLVNTSCGYYPYFSIEMRQRIKQKKVINCVITGEGGLGKTYHGFDFCRVLSKRFDVDDIVFTYPEFMRAVITQGRGIPIEFDEPSYAISKKDWYKELTKALVKTIESFRFKGKPLFIPIINKALLEKDIRTYLLQYHVVMKDRGKSVVYKMYPSQFKDKVYNYELCKVHYDLFDNNLCSKDSCLTCPKLDPSDKDKRCMIFRAKYERIKSATQEDRYQTALEESEQKEYSKLSLDEIQAKLLNDFDKYYIQDKDDIDIDLMAIALKRIHHIRLGHNKLYRLKKQIKFDHPELFSLSRTPNKNTPDKEV